MLLNKAASAIAKGLARTNPTHSTANATIDNDAVESITILEISTDAAEATTAANGIAVGASVAKSAKTPSKPSAAIATPSPTDPGAAHPSDPASATNDGEDSDDDSQLCRLVGASSKTPSKSPPLMTRKEWHDDDVDYENDFSSDEEDEDDDDDASLSIPDDDEDDDASLPIPTAAIGTNKRKAGKASIPPLALPQPPPASRKKKDDLVRGFFIIEKLNSGKFNVTCRHCTDSTDDVTPTYVKEWETVNATKLRYHLVNGCIGVDVETRALLLDTSLSGRRTRLAASLTPSTGAASLGTDTLANIRNAAFASTETMAGRHVRRTRQSSLVRPSNDGRVELLNAAEAHKIILRQVEAMVARGEPLSRLLDEYVQAALIGDHPAIGAYLPLDERTIFDKYVAKIDAHTSAELTRILQRTHGAINISFDGATINGKSVTMYNVSRGKHSMFLKFISLGSLVHVTKAEVKEAYQICIEQSDRFNSSIGGLAVDNAARHVANEVANALESERGMVVLVVRDPCHCVDLMAKALPKVEFVQDVLEDTKAILKFLTTDRVDSIRSEAIRDGLVCHVVKVKNTADTRMNTIHEHVKSVRQQSEFMASLPTNPKFKEYYDSRTAKGKAEIDTLFRRCRLMVWQSMDMQLTFSEPLVEAHKLLSRRDTPLSAYLLIVQAVRNGFNMAIHADDGLFDRVLGFGSAQDVADIVRPRFNMDGASPAGGIVGLIDKYHIWCYIVDPFAGDWRDTMMISGSIASHITGMLAHFVPLDADGSCTTRGMVRQEFEDFIAHTGEWEYHWEKPLPAAVSPDELEARAKVFTVDAVRVWIEKYGGIEGRLRWFETYASYSRFYQLVAKPLLSLRATGSMDTERSVKPLKHTIMSRDRNRLSNEKALTLFRASQNLKYLMNTKKEMKKLSTPAVAAARRVQLVQRDPLHCVDLLSKDSN